MFFQHLSELTYDLWSALQRDLEQRLKQMTRNSHKRAACSAWYVSVFRGQVEEAEKMGEDM